MGLSLSDLRQLAKPGLAAIVAMGHDSSVFMASAGARLDRDAFERQYSRAHAEIWRRLRGHLASGRVPIAVSELHGSHLVTLALAKADIVEYWFELRSSGRDSYETGQIIFDQVVGGAAERLRRD